MTAVDIVKIMMTTYGAFALVLVVIGLILKIKGE